MIGRRALSIWMIRDVCFEPALTDAAVCTNVGSVFSGPYPVKLPLSFGRDAILAKNAIYLILRNV